MAREKRRNSDKRKEKSRDAARSRRSKETEIFTELAECLPLSEHIVHQLDKASVMRLAISQLKIGDVLEAVGISDCRDEGSDEEYISSDEQIGNEFKGILAKQMENELGVKDLLITNTNGEDKMESVLPAGHTSQLYLKGLEGTVIILSHDGDFVYLSENVIKYLGLQQIEMMGQSIYDYIHPCDHEEIRNALNTKSGSGSQEHQQDDGTSSSLMYSEIRTFSIRMKCTRTTKGRNVNLKSAPYKVMKCSGRLVICGTKQEEGLSDGCKSGASSPSSQSSSSLSSPLSKPYLLAMMEPIPHPSNIEVPLDSSTFLSKHEMDMSFIFCDERIEHLSGFDPSAMVGQSYFDFHHALDSENIKKTFKDLYSKGQATTPAYRMLVANGGYIWIITQATTINNSRNQKPQSIVCVHYVLSGVEDKGVILSNIQKDLAMSAGSATPMPVTTKIETLSPAPSPIVPLTPPPTNLIPLDDVLDLQQQQEQLKLDLLPPKLKLSTESIFAPKTKDMEKPLCRPSGLLPCLTEDPEDLSCLSPTAGDDMMPLPFTNSSTKTTDFLLSPETSPMTSPMLSMVKSPQVMIGQAGLLSPGRFSAGTMSSNNCSRATSPDADYLSCVLPFEMDPMDKFLSQVDNTPTQQQQQPSMSDGVCIVPTKKEGLIGLGEEDIIDFAIRAPYIPMDADQDLDLLPTSTSTLFNLSKDDINPSVFGQTEYVFGPKETLFEQPRPLPKRSLRDMLGESPVVASIEQPPETKYLQMKRPLDMNCLEKGPPASKVARLGESAGAVSSAYIQPCQSRGVNPIKVKGNKNSVLLNLLLTGEDNSYGYKVSQKRIVSPKTNLPETNMFNTLTRQDCEVNAPTQCGKLLQGSELFNALDTDFL